MPKAWRKHWRNLEQVGSGRVASLCENQALGGQKSLYRVRPNLAMADCTSRLSQLAPATPYSALGA